MADFMDPLDKVPAQADKLKKAGQKVAKSGKSPDRKIQARALIKKVIQGLPWEAKQMALDIIRQEIQAGSGIGSAGTMDATRLPVDYTAKPDSDVKPWTRKDARRAAGETGDDTDI
jgi:hypothetical protein